VCLQYFDTVGWVLRPVKNRRPYNLYCVGGDVKPCSINQSILVQKDDEAGSCRSTDVTKLLQKQRRDWQSVQWQAYAGFCLREDFCPFIEEPPGSKIRRYHHENFFSISCVAIAVENL